jgi:hypothetical protein
MADAQDRGWGPPCPQDDTMVIHAGDVSYGFRVHKRVARIFTAFIDELVERGYTLKNDPQRDDWGYACRHIDNDPHRPWSNHAWGLAVDINALDNPNQLPLTTDMPSWVKEAGPLKKKYGLRWGGTYSGTPDPMHFEFMGTPDEADRITARLAKEELTIVDADTKKYFEAKFKQTNDLATGLFRVTDHGNEDAGRANHHKVIRDEVKDLRTEVHKELGDLRKMLEQVTKTLDRIAPPRRSRSGRSSND